LPAGQSLEELTRIAQARPQDVDAWHALGRAFVDAGDTARAVMSLRHAMGLAATDAAQLSDIGASLLRAGASSDALAALRRAVQLDPTREEAHERIGATLLAMGDAEAAALSLKVALTRLPDAARLRVRLGRALLTSGRTREALGHAQRAAEVLTQDADAHRLLAQIHRELDQPQDYAAALERLSILDPTDAEAAIALGLRRAREGRHDEALAILDQARKHAPARADIQVRLGRALMEAGAIGGAVRCFRETIRINPDLAEAHLELGLALRAGGALKDAIHSLRSATRLAPTSGEMFFHLGMTLRTAGENREAASMLIKAAANTPDDERIQAALATALTHLRGAPAAQPQRAMDDAASGITSDLAIFSLAELLEFLLNQHSTGVLEVTSDHGIGRLELFDGSIAAASYPSGKPLGEQVLELDLITQTDLKRSVVDPNDLERDAIVANVLLSSQLVDRTSLYDVLSKHVRSALTEMLGWSTGSASFRRTAATQNAPEILVDTRWALLEATRLVDESRR
jgi:tetratricopeptide (TPR) repeat protein